MKQKRFLGFLPALCLLALPLHAQSSNTLALSDDSAEFGTVASVELSLDTTDNVQGVVAVWQNTAEITGQALIVANGAGEALEDADTVVTSVEPDHMILGVVMDSDPNDGEEILLPGVHVLATAEYLCGTGPEETTTVLEFVDGEHATVEGGPALDNIVVVGGLSIGAIEGLNLDDGEVKCTPTPDSLTIESSGNPTDPFNPCGEVRILLTHVSSEVEGFALAVCHNTEGLELTDITLGADSTQADFTAFEIDPFVGGTFGVVIDLEDPMGMPPNIQPGANQHIATYSYCCTPSPQVGDDDIVYNLEFCDNQIGDPLKENLIVVGGRSITQEEGLELRNGTFTCGAPTVIVREDCTNGEDDDGDGDVDCDDSDCFTHPACLGQSFLCGSRDLSVVNEAGIPKISGPAGTDIEVCFYVLTQEDNAPGHAQFDHIQGFSMAVSYCCGLRCKAEEFDITDTILDELGAEFVSIQCDNNDVGEGDPEDDDGCELIIGVLIDALPPFDGATIPPLPDPQLVGCVTFVTDEGAECGDQCPIEFVDNLDGRGNVPVKNLMSLENHSFRPNLVPCEVCIEAEPRFHRGDCNFSLMGSMAVDIADAAAVVSFLFLPGSWQFDAQCLDACDCNDDGRVDLADAMCILQYLFQMGRVPPDPYPGLLNGEETPPGPDPTEDKLDCVIGTDCVLVPH